MSIAAVIWVPASIVSFEDRQRYVRKEFFDKMGETYTARQALGLAGISNRLVVFFSRVPASAEPVGPLLPELKTAN